MVSFVRREVQETYNGASRPPLAVSDGNVECREKEETEKIGSKVALGFSPFLLRAQGDKSFKRSAMNSVRF